MRANPEQEAKNAINDAGWVAPDVIIFDDKEHRFSVDPKKPRGTDGWYVGHPDTGVFVYANWKTGDTRKIRVDTRQFSSNVTPIKPIRTAKPDVATIYNNAKPGDSSSAYLMRKGIKCPDGVRRVNGLPSSKLGLGGGKLLNGLIVPMALIGDDLTSLQYIPDAPGEKKMFAGGISTSGLFFTIGGSVIGRDQICIAEGMATAASVYEATGIVTVVAFSAGNLKKVASSLGGGLLDIIVAADNDDAGRKSVEGLLCRVAYPVEPYNDFNDMFVGMGGAAVAEVIRGAKDNIPNSTPSSVIPTMATVPGVVRDGKIIRIAEAKSALRAVSDEGAVALLLLGTGYCEESQELVGIGDGKSKFDPLALEKFFALARKNGWHGLHVGDADIELQKSRTLGDVFSRWGIALVEGSAVFIDRHFDLNGYDGWTMRFIQVGSAAKVFGNMKYPDVVEGKEASTLKWVSVYETWLRSRDRKTYTEFYFAPSAGIVAKPGYELPSGAAINLYEGLAINPIDGDCELIKQHIMDIWCCGDIVVYDYVIGWIARMYQHPNERGHAAIALRSGQGSGKNIILDPMVKSFGKCGLMVSRSDDITGRFNDALATSVLLVSNEAVWGGDKKASGALKSLVTDEILRCEKKFLPAFNVKSCMHIIVSSNEDWSVPLDIDDRRWIMLDVSMERRGDYQYFNALSKANFAAFVYFLLQHDLTDFNPRDIPEGREATTVSKQDNKLRNANTVIQWWHQVMMTGVIYIEDESKLSMPRGWEEEEVVFDKKSAYEAYGKWCKDHGRRSELMNSWTRNLATLGVDTADRRVMIGGDRVRVYQCEKLIEMQKKLEKLL